MYAFILIIDVQLCPEKAGDLLKTLGAVRQEPGGRYLVEGSSGMDDGWLAISRRDSIAGDYDAKELELLRGRIKDPAFFLVEGRDTKTAFANNFLLGLDESMNALIDNDHGRIESVDSIKSLISDRVDWLHAPS